MPDIIGPPAPQNPVDEYLGLKDLFVLSNAGRIEASQFAHRSDRKLRRIQKELSQTAEQSPPGESEAAYSPRTPQGIQPEEDSLHKLTTNSTCRYHCLYVEDLNNRALARTKLSRSMLDATFGEIRYKRVWNLRGCREALATGQRIS